MYNFNYVGTAISFTVKLRDHIRKGDDYRVKDYLCVAFDTWSPLDYLNHPCAEPIKEGFDYLKERGWKFFIGEWKDRGMQVTLVSPNSEYYHSKYNYEQDLETVL